jgi:hypothetical protein
LKPAKDLKPEAIRKLATPEIITAQWQLARIAARIMAQERIKTSEK